MKNQFLPYELALELKLIGFDNSCLAKYQKLSESTNYQFQLLQKEINCNKLGNAISAPLYQQCFSYFRDKCNLHPSFTRYKISSTKKSPAIFPHIYEIHIINENNSETIHVGDYNTYEKAELECIKKLIEIVKNKNLK
jgi:hypothetical protein